MNTRDKNFFANLERCLKEELVDHKLRLVEEIYQRFHVDKLVIDSWNYLLKAEEVGFPERPQLVQPKDLPRRNFSTHQGKVALIHSIAHIEFNAINLALDAAYRFRDFPSTYYVDWLQVAIEEVKHFKMLSQRLNELGSEYGELPAHHGLWEMAEQTQHDVLTRLALVPRYLEARGLDVTPAMINKLQANSDQKSAEILKVILEEEVGHVKIGSRWFRSVCEQRKLDPDSTYFELVEQYSHGSIRSSYNLELRKEAGFSEQELLILSNEGKN